MSERFFSDPVDQNIRTQCALNWKIMVSEWRSVIAVPLNVGGSARLIKPAKTVYVHAKTPQTQRARANGIGCALLWFRTAEPLGEHRFEN